MLNFVFTTTLFIRNLCLHYNLTKILIVNSVWSIGFGLPTYNVKMTSLAVATSLKNFLDYSRLFLEWNAINSGICEQTVSRIYGIKVGIVQYNIKHRFIATLCILFKNMLKNYFESLFGTYFKKHLKANSCFDIKIVILFVGITYF